MIISSIRGNNEGYVVSFGLITAIAAIILITAAATTKNPRIDVFTDVLAEKIELRVNELITQGANEDTARQLVRQTIDLVRGSE
ncbi:MAG: hypothetical protein EXQ63_02350 [Ilumatobacteraceae bacterium]|nr:hypothetical protein [Ilumatobacteraceae bacterium]